MTVFRLNLLEVAAKVGTPSAAPSRYFVRAWIALALCATACGTTPAATDAAVDSAVAGAVDAAVADALHKEVVSGSDADHDGTDLHADGTATDATLDTDVNTNCPGGARCPCATNAECDKGLCVETADAKICAAPCAGDSGCLASESCSLLDVGGGDNQTLCTPRWVSFCAPCLQNSDCAFPGSAGATTCASLGTSGSFCTVACKVAADCPSGAACSSGVCHPAGDTCACSNWAVTHQNGTSCSNKNAAGQCATTLNCAATGPWPVCLAATPTAETCNGKDDNCNGLTDDAAGPTCDDGDDCTQDACAGGVCQHLKNVVCGDGVCASGCGETLLLCPIDCHKCGDKVCSPGESPKACVEDCCGTCGDGKCVGYACGEDLTTCPQDCSQPCGDGICEKGENPGNCAMDCKFQTCGNNSCEPTDGGPTGCPKDCMATCGNCVCEKSESFDSCPNDCGYCGDGTCSICSGLGEDSQTCTADCGNVAVVGCASKVWTAFCQDDSPCTDDVCQPGKGCVHLAAAGTCTDGNACTTGDACSNGVCAPGAQLACTDNNLCTADSCDPASGCTSTNADGIACNDDDPCTLVDLCGGGACVSGQKPNCDDVNVCTDDSCVGGSCVHAPNSATCTDDNACTAGEHCGGGTCAGVTAVKCDDANPCTDDYCDVAIGCTASSLEGQGCDDNNACTISDKCANSACAAGSVKSCDDGNACTVDSCDPAIGCTTTFAEGASCGVALVCDPDANACVSTCKPGTTGCPCGTGSKCVDSNTTCNASGLCVACTVATASAPGCAGVCASTACNIPGADTIAAAESDGATCVCTTQPGYFSLPNSGGAIIPCDADGDGWVTTRWSADVTGVHAKNAAHCVVHFVSAFELRTEGGAAALSVDVTNAVPAFVTVKNGVVALLEPEVLDDPAKLQDAVANGTFNKMPGALGLDDRMPVATELNPLTKVCSGNASADFNANGIPDGQEPSFDAAKLSLTPEQLVFLRFSYFLELEHSWYQPPSAGNGPGKYVVQENSRLAGAVDGDRVGFQLNQVDPPTSATGTGPDDYWRTCTRKNDTAFPVTPKPTWPSVSFVGNDFAEWSSDSKVFGHHSQFKCKVFYDPATTTPDPVAQPWMLSVKALSTWQVESGGFINQSTPSLQAGANPAVPVPSFILMPTPDEAALVNHGAWVAATYQNYDPKDPTQPANYVRGCINECVDVTEPCPASDWFANTCFTRVDDYGKALCGCACAVGPSEVASKCAGGADGCGPDKDCDGYHADAGPPPAPAYCDTHCGGWDSTKGCYCGGSTANCNANFFGYKWPCCTPDGTPSHATATVDCGGTCAACNGSPHTGPCGMIDCADGDAAVHPGAPEACNGKDDDCNGKTDNVTCTDSNACTTDTCNGAAGCAHAAVSCNDSNACTADSCDTSTGCKNVAKSCDDGNYCSADSCDKTTGACSNVFNGYNFPCNNQCWSVCPTGWHDVCTPTGATCVSG